MRISARWHRNSKVTKASSANDDGGFHCAGYVISVVAAIISLVGLKFIAPALTPSPTSVNVLSDLKRSISVLFSQQFLQKSTVKESTANMMPVPQTLTDFDRDIFRNISGLWINANYILSIDEDGTKIRLSDGNYEDNIYIKQSSYPFMIVCFGIEEYTMLIDDDIISIYNTSLFPPLKLHRKKI